ncbi:hypothetical protein ACLMJK_005522 [Lecanora helva]
MSINWVMLDGQKSFVRLPREKILFTSPARTSLALQTPNTYPGKEPLSIKCSDGKAIITNQRLQDTHVSAPFFGPNVWEGIVIPTAGGGIPTQHTLAQIRLTFKEGGAFDFSNTYERIRETVIQAAETARENGRPVNSGIDVDLEQLPAYEETPNGGRPAAPPQIQRPTPISPNRAQQPRPAPRANNGVVGLDGEANAMPAPTSNEPAPPPNEPPPGYEETQQSSVANHLERTVEKGSS